MGSYIISPCFLEKSTEKIYITEVLLPFTQQNSLNVGVDKKGEILDHYNKIADTRPGLAAWIQLMGIDPSNFKQIVEIDMGITHIAEKFLFVCISVVNQQKMIIHNYQDWHDYKIVSSNELEFRKKKIKLYDKDEAITEIKSNLLPERKYEYREGNFDAFIKSAKGETNTFSFNKWAGGDRVTLAIVFTDIVGSTALGEELGDSKMNVIRHAHFDKSRKLIKKYQGKEIKTIGDSFMAAFKSVSTALDYAISLYTDTGHQLLKIRAGIHIGSMQVEEEDVFGGTVNFAARVVGAIKTDEIWLSSTAKTDIDQLGAKNHAALKWERHDNVEMKGFPGKFTLWSVINLH